MAEALSLTFTVLKSPIKFLSAKVRRISWPITGDASRMSFPEILGFCAGSLRATEECLLGLVILVLFPVLLTPSIFSAFLYTRLSFKDPASKDNMVRDLMRSGYVQWSHNCSQQIQFRKAEEGKDAQEEKVRSNLTANFDTEANECLSALAGCSWASLRSTEQ